MKTLSAKPAFTLVEIVIVIMMIGIFSTGFAISYSNSQKKVTFESDKEKVLSIIQKARNLSLTNLMVNDTQADYYYLEVTGANLTGTGLTLTGYDIDGVSSLIDSVTFSSGIYTNLFLKVKYYPPYGTVTFDSGIHGLILMDGTGNNASTITISEFGGFADAT